MMMPASSYADYAVIHLEALRAAKWEPGERSRWVVKMRDSGVELDVIARVLGVTKERVRQIYNIEKKRPDDTNLATTHYHNR